VSEFDPAQLPADRLAYVGDAVQELDVRTRLVRAGRPPGAAHREAVRRVRAEAQAGVARRLWPHLSEEERAVFVRVRNSRHPAPAGQAPEVRHLSQALEGLLGYLYLSGRHERLAEVLTLVWEALG
jgi:ribonuclease-3 family protein